MRHKERPLVWLHWAIRTPPFSAFAREQAGFLLRLLQHGEALRLPVSRPMPVIGKRCHDLRINDRGVDWRISYWTDTDAVIVLEIFKKQTRTTPKRVIRDCQERLRSYDDASK